MVHYIWVSIVIVLFLYLFLEIINVIISKRPYVYLLYLSYKLRKNIRKQVPDCFSIKISTFTISLDREYYSVYVEIKLVSDSSYWTNDWMIVNPDGTIFKTNLFDNMYIFSDVMRDEKLKKLGI